MRHLMFCISGWASVGKDEILGHLVKTYGTIHTGLADPGKRHAMDAYGFSYDQLWGPSEFRNAGDPRYPKPAVMELGFKNNGDGTLSSIIDSSMIDQFCKSDQIQSVYKFTGGFIGPSPIIFTIRNTDPAWFLSPREFLQKYMELANTLYADTWIDRGITDHKLLATGRYSYSKTEGLRPLTHYKEFGQDQIVTTGFSDFRHINECHSGKSSAGWHGESLLIPILIRVKRPTITKPPFKHRSETEQTRIRDAAFDFIVDNNSTLESLYRKIDNIVSECSRSTWVGKAWSKDNILPFESDHYTP